MFGSPDFVQQPELYTHSGLLMDSLFWFDRSGALTCVDGFGLECERISTCDTERDSRCRFYVSAVLDRGTCRGHRSVPCHGSQC